jgi:hypothetical protein
MSRLNQKRALCKDPQPGWRDGEFVQLVCGEDDYTSAVIVLRADDWRDMGEPAEVTVTIQPGDHLNTNPGNPHAYASEWRDGDTMPGPDTELKANPEFL